MAILYPGLLPIGALLDSDFGQNPAAIVPPPAPIWFSADAQNTLEFNKLGRVAAWHAMQNPALRLEAISHNRDGTQWDQTIGALRFQAKSNGGLAARDLLPRGDCFSIAMIYSPPPKDNAMTLFSLQAIDSEDYIFLSVFNGAYRFAYQENEATFPQTEPKTLTLLVLSTNGSQVKLCLDDGTSTAVDFTVPALPHDVFMACRGSARSLVNKLGSFDLTDVMIWPDRDVLAGPQAQAPKAIVTHWQERLRNGA